MGCTINFKFPNGTKQDTYITIPTNFTEQQLMADGLSTTLDKIAEIFCDLSKDDVTKQHILKELETAMTKSLLIKEYLTDDSRDLIYVPNKSGQDIIDMYPTLCSGISAAEIGNVKLVDASALFKVDHVSYTGLTLVLVRRLHNETNDEFFIVPENHLPQFLRFIKLRQLVRKLGDLAAQTAEGLEDGILKAKVERALRIVEELQKIYLSINTNISSGAAIEDSYNAIIERVEKSINGAKKNTLAYKLVEFRDEKVLELVKRIHALRSRVTELLLAEPVLLEKVNTLNAKENLTASELKSLNAAKLKLDNLRASLARELKNLRKNLQTLATNLEARRLAGIELFQECYVLMGAYSLFWKTEKGSSYSDELKQQVIANLVLKQAAIMNSLIDPTLIAEAAKEGLELPTSFAQPSELLSTIFREFDIASHISAGNDIVIPLDTDESPLNITDKNLADTLNGYYKIHNNIESAKLSAAAINSTEEILKAVNFLEEYIHNSAAINTTLTTTVQKQLAKICSALQYDNPFNPTGNPFVDAVDAAIKKDLIPYETACALLREANLLTLPEGAEYKAANAEIVKQLFQEHFLSNQEKYLKRSIRITRVDPEKGVDKNSVIILKLDHTIFSKLTQTQTSEDALTLLSNIKRCMLITPDTTKTPDGKYLGYYVYLLALPGDDGSLGGKWIYSKERLNIYDYRHIYSSFEEMAKAIKIKYDSLSLSTHNNLFLLPKVEYEELSIELKEALEAFELTSNYYGQLLTTEEGAYTDPKTFVHNGVTYYYTEDALEFKSKAIPYMHGWAKPGTIYETIKAFDEKGKRIVRGKYSIPLEMSHKMFEYWVNEKFEPYQAIEILACLKTNDQKALFLTHANSDRALLDDEFKEKMLILARQIGKGTTEYHMAYTTGRKVRGAQFAKFRTINSVSFTDADLNTSRNHSGETLLDLKTLQKVFAAHNIHVELVNTAEALRIAGVPVVSKGFMRGGIVYLNTDAITADTPFHEFSHLLLAIARSLGAGPWGATYEDLLSAYAQSSLLLTNNGGLIQLNLNDSRVREKLNQYKVVLENATMSQQELEQFILEELFAEDYGKYLADSLSSPFYAIFNAVDETVKESPFVNTDKGIKLSDNVHDTIKFFAKLSTDVSSMKSRMGFSFFRLSDESVDSFLSPLIKASDESKIFGLETIQDLEKADNAEGLYLVCK